MWQGRNMLNTAITMGTISKLSVHQQLIVHWRLMGQSLSLF